MIFIYPFPFNFILFSSVQHSKQTFQLTDRQEPSPQSKSIASHYYSIPHSSVSRRISHNIICIRIQDPQLKQSTNEDLDPDLAVVIQELSETPLVRNKEGENDAIQPEICLPLPAQDHNPLH